MESTASLNTKIDPEEKRQFVENTAALGMTPSAAVKIFVRMFNECKGFPFAVRLQPRINYESADLLQARVSEGHLIVPASWRDDDDDDE